MKANKILKLIIIAIALLPCMMIFNESNTIVPNIVGLIYGCALYMAYRHNDNIRKFCNSATDDFDLNDKFK